MKADKPEWTRWTDFGGDVVVEMPGVSRIAHFGAVGCLIAVNVLPVNATEPGVLLPGINATLAFLFFLLSLFLGKCKLTLMRSAPSTLAALELALTKPLRRAWTMSEFGRVVDDAA